MHCSRLCNEGRKRKGGRRRERVKKIEDGNDGHQVLIPETSQGDGVGWFRAFSGLDVKEIFELIGYLLELILWVMVNNNGWWRGPVDRRLGKTGGGRRFAKLGPSIETSTGRRGPLWWAGLGRGWAIWAEASFGAPCWLDTLGRVVVSPPISTSRVRNGNGLGSHLISVVVLWPIGCCRGDDGWLLLLLLLLEQQLVLHRIARWDRAGSTSPAVASRSFRAHHDSHYN